jgi:carboxymethylenebutenolidase
MSRGLEITIPEGDGAPATPAYAVCPEGAQRGVVVIHEIGGRQPEIDRVVERFGDTGYAAVAPDLFDRGAWKCLREVFGALRSGATDGVAIRQGRNARAWLCERTGIPSERVGLIGFCLGGSYALLGGAGWAAISANYGMVPKSHVLREVGPVIACYGSRDRTTRKSPGQLRERLAEVGHEPAEIHEFDAGHSFLTDRRSPWLKLFPLFSFGDYPDARAAGWDKIMTFFDRHLGA